MDLDPMNWIYLRSMKGYEKIQVVQNDLRENQWRGLDPRDKRYPLASLCRTDHLTQGISSGRGG